MPRIKSEIFEDVAKILDDAGLFKEAYPSLEAYKDDAGARIGSDDISTIEALYGIKPEGQNYDQNIMQEAHPNSVIIAPSYDKLNGLVENNIERNNIMSNIALKPNTGNHTNHKYAQSALAMELIRVANEMDARNKEDLFKLADSCLVDLYACQKQSNVKTAVAPAAAGIGILGITAIIAVSLGAVWLISHTDNLDEGPLSNIDNAIKALENLKTNSWYESDVDEIVQQEADKLIAGLSKLKGVIVKFNQVSDFIYKPRTLTKLNELIALKKVALEHGDKIQEAVTSFKNAVMELEPFINQSIENFSDEYYQKQHTSQSTISRMTGWVGEALHGRWGLIANDFISVVNALNPLKKSLMYMTKRLSNFDNVVAKYESDVKNAYAKFDHKDVSLETSKSTQPIEQAKYDVEPKPKLNKDIGDIIKSVTGKEPTGNELEFLQHLMSSDDE